MGPILCPPEFAWLAALGGCTGCIAVISVLVLVLGSWSWDSVPPLQIALAHNPITQRVDLTRSYGPGMYWMGPYKRFLEFPSTMQVRVRVSCVRACVRIGANRCV